jgi:hypothetical protein
MAPALSAWLRINVEVGRTCCPIQMRYVGPSNPKERSSFLEHSSSFPFFSFHFS